MKKVQYYSDVTWASWCLKSLTTQLFIQQLVQTNEIWKFCITGHWGIHKWPLNSPHKVPVIQKAFLWHHHEYRHWLRVTGTNCFQSMPKVHTESSREIRLCLKCILAYFEINTLSNQVHYHLLLGIHYSWNFCLGELVYFHNNLSVHDHDFFLDTYFFSWKFVHHQQ